MLARASGRHHTVPVSTRKSEVRAAIAAAAGAVLAFALGVARAADEPRVEMGAGVLVVRVPDYRGSDRYDVRVLPVPYASYRSENVQLSREGLRARLFTYDALTASASAAVNLTGRGDNPDRAGMPQLSPTVEIGPSLDWRLDGGPNWLLRARVPVRAAIAAEGLKWIGGTALPHLRLDYDQDLGDTDLFWLASAGINWGSSEYHQYFYGVPAAFATPVRPVYEARAGYSGARATLSATGRAGRWRGGVFGSYDELAGAVFVDSPLVKADRSLNSGFFVSYVLYARGGRRVIEELP